MDFSLSEEQQEVQNLARKILEDLSTHDRRNAAEAGDEGIDRRLWSELARANLLGVGLPEAVGGSALGFFTTCLLLSEVGRSVAAVPALPTLVLGALPIAHFGSEAQKSRWLPGVVNGDVILSGALLEPGNDESARPATRARPEADGWRLDGLKVCVPAARLAARIVVPAATADAAVGLFLLDPMAEGVAIEAQRTTDRQPHARIALDGARVEADDVLCAPGSDPSAAEWMRDRATVATCAQQLGVSEKALKMTAEYTTSRIQFDRPVGSFQAVHSRAADAFIQLEAMRLTTWLAAWRLGEGRAAPEEVAVAKYWAAEGGQFVGYAAQHLHGGIGIDVDYPLYRYYLWAKQSELILGSAPVQLANLGARFAREPASA